MFQVIASPNALCMTSSSAPFDEAAAISSYGLLPEPARGAAISAVPGAIVRLYAAYYSPRSSPAAEWRQTQQRQLSATPDASTSDPEALLANIRVPIQKDVEAVFGRRCGGSVEMFRAPQKVSQVFLVCGEGEGEGEGDNGGSKATLLRAGYQGAYCAAIAAGAQKLFLTVPAAQPAAAKALEEIVEAHKEFALGAGRNSIREVHVVVSTLDTQALLEFVTALTKSRIPYKHNEGQLK